MLCLNIKHEMEQGHIYSMAGGSEKIGDLFWYSIQSVDIDRQVLEAKMAQHEIDLVFLPNPIRASDAFRRATYELQAKKVATGNPQCYLNYLIREVTSDSKQIQRNIVVEKVDKQGKALNYETDTAVIVFDKKLNEIFIQAKGTDNLAIKLAEEAKRKFMHYSTHYDSQNIRQVMMRILESFSPISVRQNGGIYFVPVTYANELVKLAGLIEDLGSSCSTMIPLFNIQSSHDMVNRQLVEDVKGAIEQCEAIFKNPNATKVMIKDAMANAKKVATIYQDYRSIVELQTEVLDEKIGDLRMNAINLFDRLADFEMTTKNKN